MHDFNCITCAIELCVHTCNPQLAESAVTAVEWLSYPPSSLLEEPQPNSFDKSISFTTNVKQEYTLTYTVTDMFYVNKIEFKMAVRTTKRGCSVSSDLKLGWRGSSIACSFLLLLGGDGVWFISPPPGGSSVVVGEWGQEMRVVVVGEGLLYSYTCSYMLYTCSYMFMVSALLEDRPKPLYPVLKTTASYKNHSIHRGIYKWTITIELTWLPATGIVTVV